MASGGTTRRWAGSPRVSRRKICAMFERQLAIVVWRTSSSGPSSGMRLCSRSAKGDREGERGHELRAPLLDGAPQELPGPHHPIGDGVLVAVQPSGRPPVAHPLLEEGEHGLAQLLDVRARFSEAAELVADER